MATNCCTKVAQIFRQLFGLFLIMSLVFKVMCVYFLCNFLWKIGQLFIPSSGHIAYDVANTKQR